MKDSEEIKTYRTPQDIPPDLPTPPKPIALPVMMKALADKKNSTELSVDEKDMKRAQKDIKKLLKKALYVIEREARRGEYLAVFGSHSIPWLTKWSGASQKLLKEELSKLGFDVEIGSTKNYLAIFWKNLKT